MFASLVTSGFFDLCVALSWFGFGSFLQQSIDTLIRKLPCSIVTVSSVASSTGVWSSCFMSSLECALFSSFPVQSWLPLMVWS